MSEHRSIFFGSEYPPSSQPLCPPAIWGGGPREMTGVSKNSPFVSFAVALIGFLMVALVLVGVFGGWDIWVYILVWAKHWIN